MFTVYLEGKAQSKTDFFAMDMRHVILFFKTERHDREYLLG